MDSIKGYIKRYKRILRINESYQTKLDRWMKKSDEIQQFLFAVSVNLRLSLEAQCAREMLGHVMEQEYITHKLMLEQVLSDLSVESTDCDHLIVII